MHVALGGAVVIARPSPEQYAQALGYYSANIPIETIGERLGIDDVALAVLENDGWPADVEANLPAMPALRVQVLQRIARMRGGQLDTLAALAETASKIGPTRSKTTQTAAQIENALISVWGRIVTTAMKDASTKTDAAALLQLLTSMAVPKSVQDCLKTLRTLQEPTIERGFVEVFSKAGGDTDDGRKDSLEESIIRDLAELSPAELDDYVRTGKLPSRQGELDFAAKAEHVATAGTDADAQAQAEAARVAQHDAEPTEPGPQSP